MNTIVFFALGKCNHKNVCHKCVLRVRLLMDDKSCSICKTDCDEIVISRDPELLWEDVCDKQMIKDKEDAHIFYEDAKARTAGMELRSLNCLMHNCTSK